VYRQAQGVHAKPRSIDPHYVAACWDDSHVSIMVGVQERINVSVEELSKEKECVKHLFGEYGGVCEVVLDTSLPGEA